MLRAFAQWLGPRWTAALIGLVVAALAGGIALQAAYPGAEWRPAAQVALVWLALAGLGVALLMRVSPARRGRVLLAFAPGLALIASGIVAPDLAVFFVGAGIGWMAATQLALRSPTNMTYQADQGAAGRRRASPLPSGAVSPARGARPCAARL